MSYCKVVILLKLQKLPMKFEEAYLLLPDRSVEIYIFRSIFCDSIQISKYAWYSKPKCQNPKIALFASNTCLPWKSISSIVVNILIDEIQPIHVKRAFDSSYLVPY